MCHIYRGIALRKQSQGLCNSSYVWACTRPLSSHTRCICSLPFCDNLSYGSVKLNCKAPVAVVATWVESEQFVQPFRPLRSKNLGLSGGLSGQIAQAYWELAILCFGKPKVSNYQTLHWCRTITMAHAIEQINQITKLTWPIGEIMLSSWALAHTVCFQQSNGNHLTFANLHIQRLPNRCKKWSWTSFEDVADTSRYQ